MEPKAESGILDSGLPADLNPLALRAPDFAALHPGYVEGAAGALALTRYGIIVNVDHAAAGEERHPVARMEPKAESGILDSGLRAELKPLALRAPDFAALHPGYVEGRRGR